MNQIIFKRILVLFIFIPLGMLAIENKKVIQLLTDLNESREDSIKFEILMNISEVYLSTEPNKAIHYCQLAREKALKIGFWKYKVDANILSSELYKILNLMDSSAIFADRAIQFCDTNNLKYTGRAYYQKGRVLRNMNDIEPAMKMYEKSIRYLKPLGETEYLGNAYNSKAIVFNMMAQNDSAIHYYIESHKIFTLLGDSTGIAKALLNTGNIYSDLKENKKAMEFYQEAYRFVKKEDLRIRAFVLNSIGLIYGRINENDSALNYYDRAIDIYRKMGILEEAGFYLYLNKAYVYESLQQYDKSMETYQKALSIGNHTKNVNFIFKAKFNIAFLYANRYNNIDTALKIYESILQLARDYKMTDNELEAYTNLYQTYAGIGDYKSAYNYQTKYITLFDSIYNLRKTEAINELEIKYNIEKKQASILALKNETLEKDILIKKKNAERNLTLSTSIAIIIILLLLFLISRQKVKKEKELKEKEIARLKLETKALAAKALVDGQEEERKRIAIELHDGLGVLLSTVKMQFTNFIDKNPKSSELLQKATGILDMASLDVRRISHNMMPGILTKLGLVEAIEDLFDEINVSENINAELLVNGWADRLPENVEIMIYRIIQEMVNNTLKHAEANQISLVLNLQPNILHIQYSDNGKGFEPKDKEGKQTLGLQSIKSRVQFIGGEMAVESGPGKGTTFILHLPV
ncbi:MAG: tetratricopeptide repeat protein [Bacteroidales bacterium]|nr:tetratricopeptide repeat protein [Bacteroidales bacterium]MCF8404078.1 tetratricopeptide repeat protein [Bacteroidales bacterium]